MFGFGEDMIFRIPALLIAITVHEYAHARMAVSLGDPTPRYMGRLTLNPMAHLDPLGLITLWLLKFGWAKPVPVNPNYIRNGRSGMLLVAIAGPASNIITAFAAVLLKGILYKLGVLGYGMSNVLTWIYWYNLGFAVFNLLPLPPLDGSKIVTNLLPVKYGYALERVEPYSQFILIGLLLLGIIGPIITPFEMLLDFVIKNVAYFFL